MAKKEQKEKTKAEARRNNRIWRQKTRRSRPPFYIKSKNIQSHVLEKASIFARFFLIFGQMTNRRNIWYNVEHSRGMICLNIRMGEHMKKRR